MGERHFVAYRPRLRMSFVTGRVSEEERCSSLTRRVTKDSFDRGQYSMGPRPVFRMISLIRSQQRWRNRLTTEFTDPVAAGFQWSRWTARLRLRIQAVFPHFLV
jgi:hypothetical protein